MPEFPSIAELLPHRGPAVLLERVLSHDAKTTVCAVDPRGSGHYRADDGSVPSWVGLEYMAQAVAAHGGLVDRASGAPPRPGFFLGSRRLDLSTARFEPGVELEVSATLLRGTLGRPDDGAGPARSGASVLAFDCAVRAAGSGQTMVSGVLTVYLLESAEALARDFADAD
jgi:predicted hotdog family 3-hydroxylacyl-ACP dehydratase